MASRQGKQLLKISKYNWKCLKSMWIIQWRDGCLSSVIDIAYIMWSHSLTLIFHCTTRTRSLTHSLHVLYTPMSLFWYITATYTYLHSSLCHCYTHSFVYSLTPYFSLARSHFYPHYILFPAVYGSQSKRKVSTNIHSIYQINIKSFEYGHRRQ
jgi:hypothetical protein